MSASLFQASLDTLAVQGGGVLFLGFGQYARMPPPVNVPQDATLGGSRTSCYDSGMSSAAAPTEGDVAVAEAVPPLVIPHTIGFGTITGLDRPWGFLRCAYTTTDGTPGTVDVALDVRTSGEAIAWLSGWREDQVAKVCRA
jgi:hypothetical protein